jgi:hypothetical protein
VDTLFGEKIHKNQPKHQNLQFKPKKMHPPNLEHLNGSFPFFPQQPLDHIEENPGPVRKLWVSWDHHGIHLGFLDTLRA